jgi:outer membrane lipoprotein-sorting protein
MWMHRAAAGLCLLGLTGLTGCFSSVRRVPQVQVQAPGTHKTASVGELEKALSDRDGAISTLNAAVLITASTGGEKTGKVKTYTSFRGWIYVRKPADLRVLLQLPVIGSKALDMVSDGKSFTLVIPPRNQAILGTNEVTKPSANGLENLRPAVFLDSMLVPGISSDEYVTLRESTRIVDEGKGRKVEIAEPDYDLEVFRPMADKQLRSERVVHFSRVTLLPVQQDVLDEQGRVVTQATYENYQPGEPEQFPHLVTIRRPLDQYELRIEITKVTLNAKFEPDQFEPPKIPSTYKIQHMP